MKQKTKRKKKTACAYLHMARDKLDDSLAKSVRKSQMVKDTYSGKAKDYMDHVE